MGEDRCWLVDCLGLNGPLRQYFGLYRAVGEDRRGSTCLR